MKKCLWCDTEFEPKNSRSRFCSNACVQKSYRSGKHPTYERPVDYLECEQCGVSFEVPSSENKGRRFCSRSCFDTYSSDSHKARADALSAALDEGGRVFKGVDATCKECGETFTAYMSSTQFCMSCRTRERWMQGESSSRKVSLVCPCGKETGRYNRKYCSDECRSQFRKRKSAGPTKTSECLACGKVFTRPLNYSAHRYCSVACSIAVNRKNGQRFALVCGDEVSLFDSSWEVRFIACCARFDIEWERNAKESVEYDGGHVYTPDFLVWIGGEKRMLVVEIKGYMRDKDFRKVEAARVKWGADFRLFREKDLLALEGGDLSVLTLDPSFSVG